MGFLMDILSDSLADMIEYWFLIWIGGWVYALLLMQTIPTGFEHESWKESWKEKGIMALIFLLWPLMILAFIVLVVGLFVLMCYEHFFRRNPETEPQVVHAEHLGGYRDPVLTAGGAHARNA